MCNEPNELIDEEPEALQDRCVVFLDILGFREKVKEAGDDPKKARQLDAALEKVSKLGTGKEIVVQTAAVTIFSDSVVISVKQDREIVKILLDRLAGMLWTLMQQGIWMRGGISVGKLSTAKKRPWGPAFIKAYDTETKLADSPRVVISHKAFIWLKGQNDVTDLPLKRDKKDGVWFIDIIGKGIDRIKLNPHDTQELANIKQFLDDEHEINIENPGVYQKFAWLRREWDTSLGSRQEEQEFEPYFSVTRQESANVPDLGPLPPA